MAENNEIRTTPTLAGRIVEGVKEGVVGMAIGAAAGAVTGGVLAGMDFDSASDAAKDAAKILTTEQQMALNNLAESTQGTDKAIQEYVQSVEVQNYWDSLPKIAESLTPEQQVTLQNLLSEPGDSLKPVRDFIQSAENANLRQAALDGAKEYVAAGAAAGGTFKGLEGVLSNQSDKRQDQENAVQEQQIQGVAQLASMSLAASASANEGLKVLGEHTARLLKERGQQRSAAPTLGA